MNRYIKGASIAYFTIFFNIVSGLFYTPYVISSIGESGYGIFTLVSTLMSYFMLDFGIGNSMSKFLSESRFGNSEYSQEQITAVIFQIFLVATVLISLLLVVVYFFLDNVMQGLTPYEMVEFKEIYIVMAIFTIPVFLFIPLNGILTANEEFAMLKFSDFLAKFLKIVLTLIFFIFSKSILSVALASVVADTSALIIKLVFCIKRRILRITPSYSNKELIKQIFSFSLWMMVVNIAQRFIIPITPTILGIFSNSTEIAIFSIAIVIEGYVFTFASAINGLFLPKVTELYSQNKKDEVNNLAIFVGRIQLFAISLVLFGFVIFGQEFLVLWVGDGFSKTYIVSILISMPNIIVLTQEIYYSAMIIENLIKDRAILFSIGSIVCTVLSAILAIKFGSIGSGVAIMLCLLGCHVIGMNIIYHKKLGMDVLSFFKEVHLKILPILIAVSIVFYLIYLQFYYSGWFMLIIAAAIYVVLYLFTSLFLLNNQEKKLIKHLIFRR